MPSVDDALTYMEFSALVERCTLPDIHKTFYEPRALRFEQVREHPSVPNIQIREPELSLVNGRTHYNYTRGVALAALGGDQTRRLGVIYALLASAPDNKGSTHDCVCCPHWFRSMMQLIQGMQSPMLYGYELVGVDEDQIFLAKRNPDEGN